jgi:hypothetical protein
LPPRSPECKRYEAKLQTISSQIADFAVQIADFAMHRASEAGRARVYIGGGRRDASPAVGRQGARRLSTSGRSSTSQLRRNRRSDRQRPLRVLHPNVRERAGFNVPDGRPTPATKARHRCLRVRGQSHFSLSTPAKPRPDSVLGYAAVGSMLWFRWKTLCGS